MVTVTEAWKEAHTRRLLPETFIEISFAVTEPGLQQDASAAANMEESYADTKSITSAITVNREKYSSLEWNFWGLDGSFTHFDGTPQYPGYVSSSLSGEDAAFTALPTMIISFSSQHTEPIPGITITWSETFSEWASSFRITAYRGESIVTERTVEDNTSPLSQIWLDLQGYDRLAIEVLKWSHPQHRARIARVFLGIRAIYTKDSLFGYTHTQSVDLLSAALPKNEIVFRLRNEDSRWNPENPSGAERYLMERQEVTVKYGMTVGDTTEWIDGGHFWLSGWSAPANGIEASLTARDLLEFMNERYTGRTSGTLYAIANDAFLQANLPVAETGKTRYFIDHSLTAFSTSFEGENTIAEVLQKVAHMACCVLYQDRDGVMRLEPRGKVLSDYKILPDVSYSHPEFEILKPLKSVEVSYGENEIFLLPVANSGEVQTVDNDFLKTEADAERVAEAITDLLCCRKNISGEFRADPRLDALDIVTVESKYATNAVVISEIEYSTTGGSFRGRYTGKVVPHG
jgi:hypothetical protein